MRVTPAAISARAMPATMTSCAGHPE
jgi:hypothetical protein